MILKLQATPQDVMRAVETLQEFAHEQGLPEKTIFGLALALEECGSNIVNHALQRDARLNFEVCLEHTGGAFVIELRDRGVAFDPTAAPARPSDADSDESVGGWGIQLVRRYVDEIRYTREGHENVLRLTKHVRACAGETSAGNEPEPSTGN
jgi:anti-sigma regulatory factor (Ser/Thr protein kinase)